MPVFPRTRLAPLVLGVALATACGSTVQQTGSVQRGGTGDGLGGTSTRTGATDLPSLSTDLQSGTGGGSTGGSGSTSGSGSSGAGGRAGGSSGGSGTSSSSSGSSGTGGTSTGATAQSGGSAPGITAKELRVGLVRDKSAGALNAATGASGLTAGDSQADELAVIDDINKHGGVAGRKLVPVYAEVDSTSTQTQDQQFSAVCQTFTRDQRVFVATGPGPESYLSCMDRAGIPVLDDDLPAFGEAAFAKYKGFIEQVVTPAGPGAVTIANRQWFSDLEQLRAQVAFTCDGVLIEQRPLALPLLGPRESTILALDEPDWGEAPGERWLHVTFTTATGSAWAPAGFVLGFAEIALGARERALAPGKEITASQVESRLTLWRAPTDNDLWSGLAGQWEAAGLATLSRGPSGDYVTGRGDIVRVVSSCTALDDGGVRVEQTICLPDSLEDVPRVGVVLELDPALTEASWFGRGPHECYPDRRAGAAVGAWQSSIDALHVPYIRPQECGGRSDVRWLELSAPDGRGVSIELGSPGQVSVSRYTAAELARATHHDELVPHDRLVVTIDAAHRGLGTASCGPDALPEYRLGSGEYRLVWTVRLSRPPL